MKRKRNIKIIVFAWLLAYSIYTILEVTVFPSIVAGQLNNDANDYLLFRLLFIFKIIYWCVPPFVTIYLLIKNNRLKKGEDL